MVYLELVGETELHIFIHLLNVPTTSNRSQQYVQSTFRKPLEADTENLYLKSQ